MPWDDAGESIDPGERAAWLSCGHLLPESVIRECRRGAGYACPQCAALSEAR